MWWADVVKPKKLQGKHCIRELVFQTAEGSTLLFLTKKKKKILSRVGGIPKPKRSP